MCCFILLTTTGFAQIQTAPITSEKIIWLSLPKGTTGQAYKINISKLIVRDSRDDTSNVGYHNYKRTLKLYILKKGFVNELHTWFSDYLMINEQNKTGTTLFIDIKKLRVSNQTSPAKDEYGHEGKPNNGWDDGLVIKIEYYLEKDNLYTPLYRFDSIIASPEKFRNAEHDFMASCLVLSLDKLFTLNLDMAVASKNKISLTDIDRVNVKRYNFPIYSNQDSKPGVYKTFEEFKMNTPSLTDFEFKKGTKGDILYVKENNESYPARNVWGFCDGKNFYINSGDKYSKLIRTGYSFYFEGIKSLSRKTKHDLMKSSAFNYATNTGVKTTEFDKEIRYFQVDMENGKVY